MRVLKFGGTSVADGERIVHVAHLVAGAAAEDRVAVVVSALAGVTDTLMAATEQAVAGDDGHEVVASLLARHTACLDRCADPGTRGRAQSEIGARLAQLSRLLAGASRVRACPPPIRDRILATGERLSMPLLAAALRALGVRVQGVDGAEVIATDASFGEAEVDQARTLGLAATRLRNGSIKGIAVVTGFVGGDARRRTTTLGRGGSDYTAALLGAALGAERVEIWTDVDGVLSGPPRLVPEATTVPRLGYMEAGELACLGGKVLHPNTMHPLAERGIPILVRNTFAPEAASTCVHHRLGGNGSGAVRVVTAVEDAVLFTLEAAASSAALGALEAAGARPLLARRGADALRLVTAASAAERVAATLRRSVPGAPVRRRDGFGVVAAVGEGCAAGARRRFAAALSRKDIEVAMIASRSSRALCAAVDGSEVAEAVRLLHRALVSEDGHAAPVVSTAPVPRGMAPRPWSERSDWP